MSNKTLSWIKTALVFVGTVAVVVGGHWMAGLEFERSPQLASTYVTAVVAGCVSVLAHRMWESVQP
jgi:membrane-anchored protein YejM (alkaline phosphatase superfamily)